MHQLQAGYIIEEIQHAILQAGLLHKSDLQALTRNLSFFNVEADWLHAPPSFEEDSPPDPLLVVAFNLIQRGLPTRLSAAATERLLTTFFTVETSEALGHLQFNFDLSGEHITNTLRAFYAIDPRIKQDKWLLWHRECNVLDSESEYIFFSRSLKEHIGEYILQLVEPQRALENILRYASDAEGKLEKYLRGAAANFNEQRIDFTLEFPYQIQNNGSSFSGIVFEVDGPHHLAESQRRLDQLRDGALEKAEYAPTCRIPVTGLAEQTQLKKLHQVWEDPLLLNYKQNFDSPLYATESGLNALQLALTPFAIARVQRVVLQALMQNIISLHDATWRIVVIERDVPCAYLALADIRHWLSNLITLQGQTRTLPALELLVCRTDEFENARLARLDFTFGAEIKQAGTDEDFDLLIDISVLSRTFFPEAARFRSRHQATIRSAYSPQSYRTFYSTQAIQYAPLMTQSENPEPVPERVVALQQILRNVFRSCFE